MNESYKVISSNKRTRSLTIHRYIDGQFAERHIVRNLSKAEFEYITTDATQNDIYNFLSDNEHEIKERIGNRWRTPWYIR